MSGDRVARLERRQTELEAENARLRAQLEQGARRGAAPVGLEELRAAIDKIRMPMILTDPNLPDDPIVFVNRAFEELSGYRGDELVGRNCRFLQGPETDPAHVAQIRDAIAAEREVAVEIVNHRRDGSTFINELFISPILGRDGRVLYHFGSQLDATGWHQQRRALELSEARLRRAQEAGGVGLFTLDLAGDALTPTPEFCRLHGLPVRDSYPAAAFRGLVLPEDEPLASTARGLSSAGPPREATYRIRRADTGAVRWIARTGEVEHEGGEAVRFTGVVRDITERREAHDALARSEQRYRALFEVIDDGFCIIEFIDGPHGPLGDYVHIEANSGYERHTGIADVVGKRLREIAPAGADEWAALYGRVLTTGEPVRFERAFAEVGRFIEVSAARIEPASLRQVSVLFRDVTSRRAAEVALRRSEAEVREHAERVGLALAAGAIVGTWLWDIPADRFTVDEGFAQAVGLDPALGRDGMTLDQVVRTVHPDDAAGLATAIESAVRRGGAYAHQYRVRRADGEYRWIEANGRVEHGPDGTPRRFPGVVIDVEGRRAVEAERDRAAAALRELNATLEQRVAERTAELMRAEEQLRQAQKMEAVGQLTGGIAHDFNNLLTGISGSLDLLGKRVGEGRVHELDRYLVAAGGAARRAAALTHRLLAFSRRQTLDPRPTDVTKLIHGMAEMIRRTVGPAITVETVDMAGLWTALVDAHQLENAVLNLAINARDAMPDGGRLTIETSNRWMDDRAARERDMPPGQYLAVCVSDTGTGMDADTVARAFEPFFTTKPLGQGTGLGLSMIYGFARQSGGQVRIYSELGQGTMVCVYLPRHYGEGEGRADAGGRDGDLPRALDGETVLVVDDEPTVRMLVADVLSDLGYGAVEAEDGPAGLRVLGGGGRIDLLITDVGLPGGMNGRQVADAARLLRPDLKVLFITGYAENAAVGNGQLEPGMAVLTKPFAMDDLATKIRALIEG